jgi:hypothetical protein
MQSLNHYSTQPGFLQELSAKFLKAEIRRSHSLLKMEPGADRQKKDSLNSNRRDLTIAHRNHKSLDAT